MIPTAQNTSLSYKDTYTHKNSFFFLVAFLFNIQFLSDITHTLFFLQSTKRADMFVGGDYYYTEAD